MDISSIALSGLQTAQTAFDASANQLLKAVSPESGDTVDLSAAAAGVLSAKSEFAANLAMVKVADRMERQVVDLLG